MNIRKIGIISVLSGIGFFNFSCAHKEVGKNLDQKLSQEAPVKNVQDLNKLAEDSIENSPNLTADEKSKLMVLRKSTHDQMANITQTSLDLRAALIQDVLSPDYNSKEVALIEKRLKKLEGNKISLITSTVDQANKILGRSPERRKVMRDLLGFNGASDFH